MTSCRVTSRHRNVDVCGAPLQCPPVPHVVAFSPAIGCPVLPLGADRIAVIRELVASRLVGGQLWMPVWTDPGGPVCTGWRAAAGWPTCRVCWCAAAAVVKVPRQTSQPADRPAGLPAALPRVQGCPAHSAVCTVLAAAAAAAAAALRRVYTRLSPRPAAARNRLMPPQRGTWTVRLLMPGSHPSGHKCNHHITCFRACVLVCKTGVSGDQLRYPVWL